MGVIGGSRRGCLEGRLVGRQVGGQVGIQLPTSTPPLLTYRIISTYIDSIGM